MEQKLKKYAVDAGRGGCTIPQFCVRFTMSTASYYKMRAAGQGPREMRYLGSGVRIAEAAITDWIKQREAAPEAVRQKATLKARSRYAASGGAQ